MQTNEERKEIAARLMELSDCDGFAFDCVLRETLGLEPCNSRCAECREAITNRLADLIETEEQTCQNITPHPHYGFECSECKWDAYEPNDYGNDVCFDEFGYCPNCGCRVEH